MKQTSIEWLVEQISSEVDNEHWSNQQNITEYVKQAKEMHKEEIIDAYGHGQNNGYMYSHNKAINILKEHYYDNTFKKD